MATSDDVVESINSPVLLESKRCKEFIKPLEFNLKHSVAMSQPLLVLVTGANQGIGYYTAQHLASTGRYHVLLGARSLLKAENAAKQLAETKSIPSSLLEPVELDLSRDDSIATAAEQVKSKYGYLDILINNAGISGAQFKGTETLRQKYNEVLDTNVSGTAVVTETFLPLLQASNAPSPGRRIVFVSSELGSMTAAARGLTHVEYTQYCCSKAALNMLALNYLKRLKDENITVVVATPGFCATQLNNHAGTRLPEDGAMEIVVAVTAGKSGTFIRGGNIIPW